MRPPWLFARPPETFGKLVLVEGGESGRLARDPGRPIWVLLTWQRGPDDLPPQLAREGRGWGLRPLPQHRFIFPGGGDTPDYILFPPPPAPS